MDVHKIWKRLNEGWLGIYFSIFVGIVFATFFYYVVLANALQTDLPVVAVISSSMQHDNPQLTYYGWLEGNLKYSRTYIDSWSVSNGFEIGDMPIVQGKSGYSSPITGFFSLVTGSDIKEPVYEVGDVVVYTVEGQPAPIIHRIVKINADGTYQTKGDNNIGQLPYESSVKKEQIHGKVIFIIPKLGYVKVLAAKLVGF